ncbi:hypothetical protein M409DRAFT_24799 [Zasmidium cellare ATCC 36951]|uniref:Uncharacterized protein n=1 Tax=Zasmidium cellare ATCC 36951 TaxID=1080233 RepID=A0A6A6CCU6_ZASCE|nr:uncharacterized protein M409DRAFT_24799 [Zasmidium cellare ATCC 36951]KAF2164895.1 hypothetical protein M409DRAFT_24799 [Zasmidium cellare ATCC 36951]
MAPIPNSDFPISRFLTWAPFRLDALGLITLLGADEVARAIGSLTRNALTDYLPLFGAFKVASNQIASVEPGFALYNLTDGIWVTELAPWFTRWLHTNLEYDYNVLHWIVRETPRDMPTRAWVSMLLGFAVNFGLVALSGVQADWYGVANACSMLIQVVSRASITASYRADIDTRAQNFHKKRIKQDKTPDDLDALSGKKLLIVHPDGRLAICHVPGGLIGSMLDIKQPRPVWNTTSLTNIIPALMSKSRRRLYLRHWKQLKLLILRALAWLSFGVQLVAIGQATLLTQMCTVAVMTIASVGAIFNIGVQKREEVGIWLLVHQCQAGAQGRTATYVMLEPNEAEEEYMRDRGLLPDKRNVSWYDKWEVAKVQWLQGKTQAGLDDLVAEAKTEDQKELLGLWPNNAALLDLSRPEVAGKASILTKDSKA